jgi:plasmid stabilization system protein ParE
MRLVWTNAAVIDLEQISDYLFEVNPELANPTIQRIFASTSELKLFPRRGRTDRKEGTRELVLTQLPYLIGYEVVDQSVRVLRVFTRSTQVA